MTGNKPEAKPKRFQAGDVKLQRQGVADWLEAHETK